MNKKTFGFAACTLACLLAVAPAFAQTGTGTGSGTGTRTRSPQPQGTGQAMPRINVQDDKFVREAASGGMMEVELGRLASQKAASADVKAFGQRMVQDHTKANERLMQVAANKGLTVSKELMPEHRQTRDHLARLSGAEFDRMYMQHMVTDHKKDVASFEKEAEKGADSSLRTFAQETLPTLREHLKLAQTVAAKVGAKTDDHAGHGNH